MMEGIFDLGYRVIAKPDKTAQPQWTETETLVKIYLSDPWPVM